MVSGGYALQENVRIPALSFSPLSALVVRWTVLPRPAALSQGPKHQGQPWPEIISCEPRDPFLLGAGCLSGRHSGRLPWVVYRLQSVCPFIL